eukprot:6186383-Pleurochrysis_carterae.AAC.2
MEKAACQPIEWCPFHCKLSVLKSSAVGTTMSISIKPWAARQTHLTVCSVVVWCCGVLPPPTSMTRLGREYARRALQNVVIS